MIIKLANGTELTALGATGEKRTVQGARRDVLSFVFSADASLDDLDAVFTAENCGTLTIVNGETEHIYSGYTIRAELKREPVQISAATDTEDAVYENRVTVSMAQMTYAEQQMVSIAEQNAMLEECIVEMAQVVYA